MTLDEVKSIWNEQPIRSVNQSAAMRHLTQTRRSIAGGILLLGVVLVSGTLTLCHQVNRALADNAYTFANSYIDMAITIVGLILVIRGFAYIFRLRRALKAFKNDTLNCLDLLIRSTRDDARSIRRHLPLMLGGILLLGVLSRVQLLHGGVEFNGGWAEIILVGIVILCVYAGFRFRLQTHILPRLESLEATRRELVKEVGDMTL